MQEGRFSARCPESLLLHVLGRATPSRSYRYCVLLYKRNQIPSISGSGRRAWRKLLGSVNCNSRRLAITKQSTGLHLYLPRSWQVYAIMCFSTSRYRYVEYDPRGRIQGS